MLGESQIESVNPLIALNRSTNADGLEAGRRVRLSEHEILKKACFGIPLWKSTAPAKGHNFLTDLDTDVVGLRRDNDVRDSMIAPVGTDWDSWAEHFVLNFFLSAADAKSDNSDNFHQDVLNGLVLPVLQ